MFMNPFIAQLAGLNPQTGNFAARAPWQAMPMPVQDGYALGGGLQGPGYKRLPPIAQATDDSEYNRSLARLRARLRFKGQEEEEPEEEPWDVKINDPLTNPAFYGGGFDIMDPYNQTRAGNPWGNPMFGAGAYGRHPPMRR